MITVYEIAQGDDLPLVFDAPTDAELSTWRYAVWVDPAAPVSTGALTVTDGVEADTLEATIAGAVTAAWPVGTFKGEVKYRPVGGGNLSPDNGRFIVSVLESAVKDA